MQNLMLMAVLVLDIWRHNISLGRRERVMKFGYYPRKRGLTLKKLSFYVQNRSSRQKINPSCQFQQFSSRGKFFIFKIFGTSRWEKNSSNPLWLISFLKIWSEHVLRIKTKSHQVWEPYSKRFLTGNSEFGHPGLWASPWTWLDWHGLFWPSVIGPRLWGYKTLLTHHNFAVIALIIMTFGIGIKLDAFHTKAAKRFCDITTTST